jgi:fructose/tagatose bisphosphate aldolase
VPSTNKHSDADVDAAVAQAVFGADDRVREAHRCLIREMASDRGVFPASIHGLYEAAGRGLYQGVTVPAINIRGITYHVARAVFRAAVKNGVGTFIFEIARSEMGYTLQSPAEYAACILAAAIREDFSGPVFIQGDHFQVRRRMYREEPEAEINEIKDLIREAVAAGFLNIDIDASTLVNLDKPSLEEQQAKNSQITAEMTRFIRSIEPEGTTISIGGEIGEIGKGNSTIGDLKAFMGGYLSQLAPDMKGISKISVQTGTSHGGVVLADGSIARVNLDFRTLEELSRAAREEYGLGGAVQHGASTLPDDSFDMFPQVNTVEVHLATGFQNLIYDSPHFPKDLLDEIYQHLAAQYSQEREEDETTEQFLYKTRKRAFGDFKKEMWNLPEPNLRGMMGELENRFALIFRKLNVVNTIELVKRYVVNSSPSQE